MGASGEARVSVIYGEYGEGEGFVESGALFADPRLEEFILRYGQQGLDALPEMDERVREMVEELIRAGLLEREEGSGKLRLTPRMVRGMEHRALGEIFRDLRAGVREGHASRWAGRSGERSDGTRDYEYGDPLSELDGAQTLRNAYARRAGGGGGAGAGGGLIGWRDLAVYNTEAVTDAAIAVLIDLSGSMARYGRHVAAKRVALGLRSLVSRHPLDTVDFIGFASVAEPLRPEQIPLVMPKPITTSAWQVRLRVPLEEAGDAPPHFTNLHHGLRLARRTLARRASPNKQVFIITDGQPTAHLSSVKETGVEFLNLVYPPSPESVRATLAEAVRCRQEGIRFSSFALIDDVEAMEWLGFVEQLTRLTRGAAFYCAAGDLAGAILESYISGKKRRVAFG